MPSGQVNCSAPGNPACLASPDLPASCRSSVCTQFSRKDPEQPYKNFTHHPGLKQDGIDPINEDTDFSKNPSLGNKLEVRFAFYRQGIRRRYVKLFRVANLTPPFQIGHELSAPPTMHTADKAYLDHQSGHYHYIYFGNNSDDVWQILTAKGT
jgi:hypothetical protein